MNPKSRHISPALQAAGMYLVVGFLWILFSDRVLGSLVHSPDLLVRLEMIKGWAFVLVTGVIVFAVLSRYIRLVLAKEEELSEMNRKLATLFSNLPGMAYRCANDPRWTMEFASEGAARLTGYSPSDLVADRRVSYGDLIHPDDRKRVWDTVQAAVGGNLPFELVYRIHDARGEERWVWEQGRGIRGAAGNLEALEGFVSDITELKQLEAQFRRAQKLEAIGRLAGGVAHDFNNLLTAISGYASLLARRLDPAAEKAHRDLDEIRKAADRGAGLTRQLLAFGRRQAMRPEVINLKSVVADMESMAGRLVGGDVVLVTHFDDADAWVHADRGQLEQVFMNLVVNARDAMPAGGTLAVSVSRREVPPASAADWEIAAGRYQVLEVSDTGTGIAEEVVSHIFEPFFTTKEEGKGTGLGLSTVYGIVRQNGGTVQLETEAGRGTTFLVYLPEAAAPERAPAPGPAPAAEAPGGTELVAVAEPDAGIRALLERTLAEAGYGVLDLSEVREGYAADEGPAPSLLIVDGDRAPRGPEALGAALGSRPAGTRVLFIGSLPPHGGLPDLGGAGPVFLRKPFTSEEFRLKVREALDSGASVRGSEPPDRR